MAGSPRKRSNVVLLADDSADDVALFKVGYKRAGIRNPLRIVNDGQEVVEYLEGSGKFADRVKYPMPALVVLDLKMPRKSGLEVLGWIRRNEATRELFVIVLTSSEELTEVNRAYKTGANSFLLKVPGIDEFVEQLREVRKHWL